jgi:hypothetical protein
VPLITQHNFQKELSALSSAKSLIGMDGSPHPLYFIMINHYSQANFFNPITLEYNHEGQKVDKYSRIAKK